MEPKQVSDLIKELRRIVYGQEEMIHSVVAAVCSGGNVLILGPPSCGKTRLSKSIISACDASPFYKQMSVGTREEHLVGDFDVKILREEGRLVRRWDMILTSELAVLDEFLLVPPETQKTINEILEDRTYDNQKTSVRSVICLSNPGEVDPSVYDRFTCIVETRGLVERKSRQTNERLLRAADQTFSGKQYLENFSETVDLIRGMEIQSQAYSILANILQVLMLDTKKPLFDRIVKHCFSMLRYTAWMNGEDVASVHSFGNLHYVFMNKVTQTKEELISAIQIAVNIGLVQEAIYVKRSKPEAEYQIRLLDSLISSYHSNHPYYVDYIKLKDEVSHMVSDNKLFKRVALLLKRLDKNTVKKNRDELYGQIRDALSVHLSMNSNSEFWKTLAAKQTEKVVFDNIVWVVTEDVYRHEVVFVPKITSRTKDPSVLVRSKSSLVSEIDDPKNIA